jgi:SAM-dependent methyltransferase
MALYETLAEVYEWLVPDELLSPEGSAAAFGDLLADLPPGPRVLDCAAGGGQLAVGLAQRGLAVCATDASGPMIERTRALASRHGVHGDAHVCAWEELPARGWEGAFDAVLCVGNSLTHAPGEPGRRAALAAMAGVLREGGLLAVTSRTWERLRAERPGLQVAERLVERGGRRALVVRAWTWPEDPQAPHGLEVAVAVIGADGAVTTRAERMPFWPFTHAGLLADLASAGLVPEHGTEPPAADRYLVSARRAAIERPAQG